MSAAMCSMAAILAAWILMFRASRPKRNGLLSGSTTWLSSVEVGNRVSSLPWVRWIVGGQAHTGTSGRPAGTGAEGGAGGRSGPTQRVGCCPCAARGRLVHPFREWLVTATSFITGSWLEDSNVAHSDLLGASLAGLHCSMREVPTVDIPRFAALRSDSGQWGCQLHRTSYSTGTSPHRMWCSPAQAVASSTSMIAAMARSSSMWRTRSTWSGSTRGPRTVRWRPSGRSGRPLSPGTHGHLIEPLTVSSSAR